MKNALCCLCSQTQPIPIPLAPLSTLVPRLRCSVEGLNQELEGMFICQPTHQQHRVPLTSPPPNKRMCKRIRKYLTQIKTWRFLNRLLLMLIKQCKRCCFLSWLSSLRFQTDTGLRSLRRAAAADLRVTPPSPHLSPHLPPPPHPAPLPPTSPAPCPIVKMHFLTRTKVGF